MRKLTRLLVIIMLIPFASVFAQERSVTGTVVGRTNNDPLLGVTVTVKGTTRSTQTDANGKFTVAAKNTDILQFSYVGYVSYDVRVGESSTFSVRLETSARELEVVTAYGIRREKKSLGYSTQVVDGDEIAQTRRENFINSLAGRVAGATVTSTSGVPGASSQIILRGATSMGGNNQPLFIVDGVIYDNQSLNQEGLIGGLSVGFANRNSDYGNRGMDINPADIESVTILKGPEATTLYGADGASGAIVITTKKGKPGRSSVTYDNSFRIEKLYRFPEIQKEYTIGRNGIYDPSAVANPFSILGTAAGAGVPAAFGPRLSDTSTVYDNADRFFQTGFTQQHNISVEGGSEVSSIRLSANYTDQEGIVPNTGFQKISVRLGGSTKILDKITLSTSLNYVNSTTDKATKGAGGYLLTILTWPVTSDVNNYIKPDGTRVPLRNVVNGNYSLEYDNPLWDVNKNPAQDKVDRLSGNFNIGIPITKWLNLGAILGLDYYTQYGFLATHPQSRFGYASNGFYSLYSQTTRNINNVFKATFTKRFGDFSNTLTVGFAHEDNKTKLEAQKGERFFEREFLSINNTDPLSRDARTTVTGIRKSRVFANLVTGYKMFYVSLAATNEGDSRFMSKVVEKNPFFSYGAASLSFVISDIEAVKTGIPWMNFGKARISYATTGKGPYAAYQIDYRFSPQITTGGGYAYDVTGNNFNLEPEFTKTLEYGAELQFFNNRLGIDIAKYSVRSEKQLIAARASYGTGVVIKWFNGGLVENRGLEIQLTGKPIMSKNFSWQTIFNFDRNVGEVIEMPAGLPTYYDSDTWVFGNLRSQYFPGAKLGNMASNTLRRNTAGQVLISPTSGLPIRDDEFRTVGDRQPDFKLGWVNTLSYRDFDLSFNLDFRKGGDVFNATEYLLYLTGYSTRTLDRENPIVIDGILLDGLENSSTPTKNTIAVTPNLNSDFFNNSTASEEDFVEEVSWMRLRDITLAYNLPKSLFKNQRAIKSASVFITGTDIFMITDYTGADPSVNANTASNRGFGGAGIDYGTISTPRGINFGCRLSF
ncbi:MAG: SusC/RagA family TonB-linked outer membrane protein [Chitinophagaceae bacterium]|nr:SusC/RagA family TonB-linked outer membrane protein [Chitinophagaceae bacterium]